MNLTSLDQDVVAAALPAPCWWIDRDDCWEITHHLDDQPESRVVVFAEVDPR